MASAIRRFIGTSPFLPPDPAVIRMIIPDTAPKISNDKKSLNSRHILPPSFLFRRKEAKENHLRSSHSLRSSRFRQPATQNGRFVCEPSSFLFRRKEAKENQRRESGFSALQPLSPAYNTKRTVHIRTVRFSFRAGYAGKRFPPKESLPRSVFCFFSSRKENVPLQEKKSSPFRRKEIVPL
ncbi:MAG: hypothetical protein PUH73_06705 [Clostridium sp.]|nr:hypothetical protein [Clostridium sp.]